VARRIISADLTIADKVRMATCDRGRQHIMALGMDTSGTTVHATGIELLTEVIRRATIDMMAHRIMARLAMVRPTMGPGMALRATTNAIFAVVAIMVRAGIVIGIMK